MDILERLKHQIEICEKHNTQFVQFYEIKQTTKEAAQEIERLRKHVEDMQWRDMESAPMDGSEFLTRWRYGLGYAVVTWERSENHFRFSDVFSMNEKEFKQKMKEWHDLPEYK